jgi:glutamine amidotransferase
MPRIAILDYGLGNLRSVWQAFKHVGLDAFVTSRPEEAEQAGALVLPGVGAFGDGMAGLKARGLVEPVRAAAAGGKPLLGICLGLQLMFERSSESPGQEGLGLLPGEVLRFEGPAFGAQGGLKVPHMGWNTLSLGRPHPVLEGVAEGACVYFVHSYYVKPARAEDELAWSDYGGRFCAAAGRGSLVGVQFHPEKSQAVGLKILRSFGLWVDRGRVE